jgi:hypothetical protein
MNYGDFPLEETIHIFFTTRAFATGIPGTLSAATVAVYEDITATPIQTSVAVTESLNSIAGLNAVPIVATAANGYEVGKNYHVVIEAGTVDSVSVVGEIVAAFSIGRSAAAVDLANGTDGLGAIKAETALIVADTNELQTDNVPGLIATAQADLDTITGAAGVVIDDSAANDTMISDAVWDEAQSGHVGAGTFGEIATEVASILVDTAEIGTAGAGLTNINLPNQTMDITGDITGNLSGSVGSVTGAVGSVTGAVGSVGAGGITASSIATDAIGAAELAADAVAEIADAVWDEAQADHVAAGSFGLTATEIANIEADTNELQADWTNAGRLDAILDSILAMLDDARGEPGQGIPPVNPDAMTKIDYIYKFLRNRVTATATTITVYADDATTADHKSTHSDDGATYDRGEFISGA